MLVVALTFFFYQNLLASEIENYIKPVTDITLGIGALIGLLGGLKIYFNSQKGEEDITGDIWGLFSAAFLLVISSLLIKVFLGFA